MSFTVFSVLLCTAGCVSVSYGDFHTVEVQSGEQVRLICTNFSSFPIHLSWFKLENADNISLIGTMLNGDAVIKYAVRHGTFKMTTDVNHLFLQIEPVDPSDSGLYFCGFHTKDQSTTAHTIYSATYLKVHESCVRWTRELVMGGLIIVLIIILFALVLKIRRLHTAHEEALAPQHNETVGANDLTYASLNFPPTGRRSRRPAADRRVEPNVVYAATT